MADFTKDGVTISPGSGTGNTELKVKVANPPYQGFNDKRVIFTLTNQNQEAEVNLTAKLPSVKLWGTKENPAEPLPLLNLGSDPNNLKFTLEGKGNILSMFQEYQVYIRTQYMNTDIHFKYLKIYVPSKSEDPVLELSDFNQFSKYLPETPWPDQEWIDTQDSPIYDFRIEGEVEPNTSNDIYDTTIEFGSPVSSFSTVIGINIKQSKTTLIGVEPDSVTLAADGTESSVQLSSVGAWTVE